MKAWPFLGVLLIQIILLLAHWFLFHTWIAFWPGLSATAQLALRGVLFALAFTFVAAALLSFRFSNPAVAFFYKIAVIWLGFLNFFFLGACLSWLVWYGMRAFGGAQALSARPLIAVGFALLAVLAGIFGLFNALWIRMRRIPVHLPHLPPSWVGRRAVLMSDLHLGNVNSTRFCRRVVKLASSFDPDVVFIPGDLFDGSKGDLDRMVAPLKELKPPLGVYFSTGNHEEFHDPSDYLDAIRRTGVRVLANERVTVDGMHILGISYGESTYPIRTRTLLESMSPGPETASILLNHAPIRLPIVEQAGISLQLSGHTHGGQIFPYTWLTRRIFGRFTYGLHRFGALQVYTSTGIGTWGPPMRIGSQPEIVVLEFAEQVA
ncbi:MAG TPA: metallophosphoesterase [Terracidiphilus sp.]|nr:metallophosphoesterase [Terracidiphilus sp.]